MASSSFEEHKSHMHELMQRFAHYGVVLNKDKCVFGVFEITLLGHLVTQESIKPLAQKVEAIKNFSPPTNLKQLRRFLGMVSYYRRFIPNCADTLRPLNACINLFTLPATGLVNALARGANTLTKDYVLISNL